MSGVRAVKRRAKAAEADCEVDLCGICGITGLFRGMEWKRIAERKLDGLKREGVKKGEIKKLRREKGLDRRFRGFRGWW